MCLLRRDRRSQSRDPEAVARGLESHGLACQMSAANSESPSDRPTCVHFLRETRLELGGVVKAVLDMCAMLADVGHAVTLITCDAADVPDAWRRDEALCPRVVEIKPSGLFGGLISREGLRVARPILCQADVVHLHTPWEMSNLQLARRLRADSVPYVVTIHGMMDDWCMLQKGLKKRIFLGLAGRRFLERAAQLHFTAQAEQDQSLRWVPAAAGRTTIAPCVVDLSEFEHLPGPEPALRAYPFIDPQQPTVLYLSRLHPKKGIELLIAAAAILRDRGLAFQVLIAGPGEPAYQQSLERLTAEQRLGDRVHFLGMVRGQEKLSLYQTADVFALPTYQENFGLVLAEALACRTPVVSTQGTDIWRELEQAGAKIVPTEAGPLAEAIGDLIGDPTGAADLGRRGQEYVQDWLSKDQVHRQYEQLYAAAIRQSGAI